MNKRNILLAIVFAIIAPLSLQAQFARLDKYPQIPSHYDATFVDYVKDFASGVAKTSYGQYFGQIGGNGAVLIRIQQTDQRELVGEKRPVGELAGQLRKQDLGIEIWRPGISGADGEHPHVLAEFQTADFGTQSRLCRRGGCSDVSHRIGGV